MGAQKGQVRTYACGVRDELHHVVFPTSKVRRMFTSLILNGALPYTGSFYTYGNTSRHNIFARDAPGVVDEAGVARIIRYNDFEHDPLSREVSNF